MGQSVNPIIHHFIGLNLILDQSVNPINNQFFGQFSHPFFIIEFIW
jgi:hypothetical protein